jgi:hypothetical protein
MNKSKLFLISFLLFLPLCQNLSGMENGGEGGGEKKKEGDVDLDAALKDSRVRDHYYKHFKDVFKYRRRGGFYGGKGSNPYEIIDDHLMEKMMGGGFGKHLDKGEYAPALLEAVKFSLIGGGLKGFMSATEDEVKKVGKGFFGALKDGGGKVWDLIMHGGSRRVTSWDVERWRRSISGMIKDLKKIAQKDRQGGCIKGSMGQYHFPESDDDAAAKGDAAKAAAEDDAAKQGTKSPPQSEAYGGWLESVEIYKNILRYIVKEVANRMSYYGTNDEIVFCLKNILFVLVGFSEQSKISVLINNGLVDFNGGIYGCITRAKKLSDLASGVDLDLLNSQAQQLFRELDIWVKAKSPGSNNRRSGRVKFRDEDDDDDNGYY